MSVWEFLDKATSVMLVVLFCALLVMVWKILAADAPGVPGMRLRVMEPPAAGPRASPVAPRTRQAMAWCIRPWGQPRRRRAVGARLTRGRRAVDARRGTAAYAAAMRVRSPWHGLSVRYRD